MKVYSAPEHIKKPVLNWKDIKAWKKDEERYIEEIKQFCLSQSNDKYVGEIIYFPVADGKAMYMVCSIKPLEIIHLEVGDCWEFNYIERLTLKDVLEKISQQKKLKELFS